MAVRLGRLILVACAVLALAGVAPATPIAVFNTGVNGSGIPLANNTIGDPHYVLMSVPGGTTDIRVRTSAGGWPIGPWIADDAISAWIGPANDPILHPEWECCGQTSGVGGPIGEYVYRTTFDLTGLDPITAVLSGRWSTDDTGSDILLNGVSTGITITVPGYSAWSPIFIDSGFVSGINTLDFVVKNWDDVNQMGGPTGLRVEIEGRADPIPEPGTLLLLGSGLLVLARLVRKNAA